ncbi:CCDC90 family protein [Verminephrobacter eiseniae]|uniref:DUF1640 domain-containing protein n=1 Tax=Verminephrobacter eiseniae (strain EF01-2) TaxID=391735 RepID=A1WHN3_VEREI|nr:hypothetical protein [Verminephrobacter eiseniae]ABM57140.1 conserved hypothetical protein [Verminephrobacter eiseniae EF01-2]MCW5282768.1 DUF1640 domain-containing protein [Verminephrobacter eiseniae]MCW5303084.1 DUF1640 domain-containing protein [Verminephrobacter eiseniae]MCW8180413.1 DUF1640 domain-containing protein [Verminephrobacter eiseniae]MCW8192513.1 DUF1640 domain-containing protein [Verminephrobacter eiseniae]
MSSTTFDTLKFANKLKAAGVPPAQAEAEADALAVALGEQRVELDALISAQRKALEDAVKRDFSEAGLRSENAITRMEAKIDKGFAEVDKGFAEVDKGFAEMKGEMLLLKWMLGVLVAAMAALLVKALA